MRGKNNEDRYAVSSYYMGARKETPSVFAVVCDGIGGHRAGEVAAEMAVETISQAVAQSDGSDPRQTLTQAIQQAGTAIHAQAESNPERKGMGATCVCAWVIGNRLYTASVGDSRLYWVRGDSIHQVTTDHTWIQEAIEYGAITPEQAKGHPNAHVIRRYLGSATLPEPDFRLRLTPEDSNELAEANQGAGLQPGDSLILCSDGLTDLVEPEEILSALKSFERNQALAHLTDLANQRGGHDNITMVLLEVPENIKPSSELPRPQMEKTVVRAAPSTISRYGLPCAVIFVLALILSTVGGGIFWYMSRNTPAPEIIATSPAVTLPAMQPESTLEIIPSRTALSTAVQPAAVPSDTPSPVESDPLKPTYTAWPTNTLPPATPSPTSTQQATIEP
jgi:protein phosphatase